MQKNAQNSYYSCFKLFANISKAIFVFSFLFFGVQLLADNKLNKSSRMPGPYGESDLNFSLQFIKNGETDKAIILLTEICEDTQQVNHVTIEACFLLGYIYYSDKNNLDFSKAAGYFTFAAESEWPLKDYSAFYKSSALLYSGNRSKACESYKFLIENYKKSIWFDLAKRMYCDCLFTSGRYLDAFESYNSYFNQIDDSTQYPNALYNYALTLLKLGNLGKAMEKFRLIFINNPDSVFSRLSYYKLKELRKNYRKSTYFTSEQKYKRAMILSEKGWYKKTLKELRSLSNSAKKNDKKKEELSHNAKLDEAIILYKIGKREGASKLFTSLTFDVESGNLGNEAFFWLGRIDHRKKDFHKAIRNYNKYISSFKKHKYTDEALLRLSEVYRKERKYSASLKLLTRLITEFKDSRFREDAFWYAAWTNRALGKTKKSISLFTQLVKEIPDSFLVPRALYWHARLLNSDKSEKSKQLYKHLLFNYPNSYYAFMAKQRIPFLLDSKKNFKSSKTDIENQKVKSKNENINVVFNKNVQKISNDISDYFNSTKVIKLISSNIRALKINYLIKYGFMEFAEKELNKFEKNSKIKNLMALKIAESYQADGDYHYSQFLIRKYAKSALKYPVTGESKAFWKVLYPRAYIDIVSKYASEKDDCYPFLLMSLINQESRYKIDAVSSAGALGLTQLMPYTAKDIAKRLRIKKFKLDDLLIPNINIRFGSWYLSQQLKSFDGNLVLALGAYNAGPSTVRKWIKRNKQVEVDIFIEKIPFRETRYYVEKILKVYDIYQNLYGCQVQNFEIPDSIGKN